MKRQTDQSPKPATKCPCGAPLMASGRCADTGHFPASLAACPYACPICRANLDWQGGCVQCFGSPTSGDRNTWTFPGDDYEVSGPHRVKVASGPRKACTAEQSRAANRIVQAVLARDVDVATALGMLEEVLETGEPGGRG